MSKTAWIVLVVVVLALLGLAAYFYLSGAAEASAAFGGAALAAAAVRATRRTQQQVADAVTSIDAAQDELDTAPLSSMVEDTEKTVASAGDDVASLTPGEKLALLKKLHDKEGPDGQ